MEITFLSFVFMTLISNCRYDYQMDYQDNPLQENDFYGLTKELKAKDQLAGEDLAQSSSMMSLFLPQTGKEFKDIPNIPEELSSERNIVLRPRGEDSNNAKGATVLHHKRKYSKSLSFGDLFSHLFEY